MIKNGNSAQVSAMKQHDGNVIVANQTLGPDFSPMNVVNGAA